MEIRSDLWVYFYPYVKKLITVIEITIFIVVVSVSNVLAISSYSDVTAFASETELQQAGVSGTVTDATTGDAMAGVNVQVKGTTIGAISDINGKYSIPTAINKDAVLVFSFIGYVTQEVSAAGLNVINVSLTGELKSLEEVVVVGYGTQKKETLTGSVAQIKSAQIQATKSTSVASAIQGKIVGVQIRQQTAEPGVFNSLISVRGFGAPLLVIDGVVRDGMSDFEKLNPSDIESISVLKDAAAAIYGMNADNGVLIVTTKKGIKGKTQFTYSSIFSSKQPTTTTLQKSGDAYTLRLMYNEMSRNSKLPVPTSDAELEKWRVGTDPGYTDYNWYGEAIRKFATSQQHNLSVRGGNDRITFYSSLGFMKDNGILTNNEQQPYKKYNFRTTLEANVTKGLTAKISFSGRWEDGRQPTESFFWLFKRIIVADRGWGPTTLANPNHYTYVPAENLNAWVEMDEDLIGYRRNMNLQYQTTVELNYEVPFVKGLSLGVLAGYDGNIANTRLLLKQYQLYDYRTDALGPTVAQNRYTEDITVYNRQNVQSKISYQTSIAQAHNISATFVNDIRKIYNNYLSGRRQYDDLYTHDIINQGSLTNQQTTGYRTEESYVSYLGRFNYDYKSKYLFEFSFREDGSYRYAPSRRWAFFPAFSIGWRIGQENFIKNNLPVISDLKLRGSWGKMGRDAGNAFEYFEGYTFSSVSGGYVFNPGVLTIGMVPPGVVNENLSWVNTETTDIGIDLELWKGKLGFTMDVFRKKNEGLLATRITTVPNTFGATFPQENLNSNEVKGIELVVSHKNTIGNFNYGVNANVTYSRLYYLHIEESPYQSTMSKWKSSSIGGGRIQNRVWTYDRDGIYTDITQYEENAPLSGAANGNSYMLPGMDRIVDLNGDGILNTSDQLPNSWSGVGTNPPLQFGANINASFKNFDINIGFQGSSLFTVWVDKYDNWGYGTRFPVFWTKYLDRWHTENPTADPFDPATKWIPGKWEALTANNTGNTSAYVTDKWRMDATYLRIKTLELGYTVPENLTKKIRVDALRAFVNVFNLYTFCQENVKGLDPERNEGDYQVDLTYPLMRSFNFGVEINF